MKNSTSTQFTPLSAALTKSMMESNRSMGGSTDSLSASLDDSDLSLSDDDSEDSFHPLGEDGIYYWKDSKLSNLLTVIPTYWNGTRWTEVSNVKIGQKFAEKQEFTIISWNVWFGVRNRGPRMEALGNIIKEYDPDVVALQEITYDIMEKLRKQKWIKKYFISDYEAKYVENYGNVLLSKVQFHECIIRSMESRMGRKAVFGSCIFSKGPQVSFGTFHLESYLQDTTYRSKQLQTIKETTQNFSCSIVLGDTNFISNEEGKELLDKYKDVWKYLYQKTPQDTELNPGLTFDTESNSMLKEEYDSRNMGIKRQRLDRCFFTYDTLEPIEMKILGTTPYVGTNEFISDHYGIYVKMKLK